MDIFMRVNIVFFQDVFKNHFRHTARSASDHFFSDQVFPPEVRLILPADHKVPCALGELTEIDQIVSISFIILVDGRLRSHQSDVRVAADNGSGAFIRTESGLYLQLNTGIFKISQFHCHILRCIKNGMSHLI